MTLNPVRTLSFEGRGRLYAFYIDADLEREKAEAIAEILEKEDVEPDMGALPMGIVTLVAAGNIRPCGMRGIVNVLAA